MPIQLNAPREHGFDEPLGLLSDCHRRIEKFLGVLLTLGKAGDGGALSEEHRRALAAALDYFRTASPRHNADEERSLFPRLRAIDSDLARTALAALDALEADHAAATHLHAELDRIGRGWLRTGSLDGASRDRFGAIARALHQVYVTHIEIEDRCIFPAAERLLGHEALEEIGREMAGRRGVAFAHR